MPEPVIFCHIPKTAGTSLKTILRREYDHSTFLRLYGDAGEAEKIVATFKERSQQDRSQVDVVEGHYPVGIHLSFPDHRKYITLLRDPVERLISFYYHIRSTPNHYAYHQGFSTEMTIGAFVSRGIAREEAHNGMAWYLCGGLPDGDSHKAMATARRNLDELFVVAGITEKFDESILLMKRKLNWRRTPFYVRRRVSGSAVPRFDISESTIKKINQVNRLDLELYEFARQKLDDEIEQLGKPFQRQVRVFKTMNRLFQFVQTYRIRFQSGRRA